MAGGFYHVMWQSQPWNPMVPSRREVWQEAMERDGCDVVGESEWAKEHVTF